MVAWWTGVGAALVIAASALLVSLGVDGTLEFAAPVHRAAAWLGLSIVAPGGTDPGPIAGSGPHADVWSSLANAALGALSWLLVGALLALFLRPRRVDRGVARGRG